MRVLVTELSLLATELSVELCLNSRKCGAAGRRCLLSRLGFGVELASLLVVHLLLTGLAGQLLG